LAAEGDAIVGNVLWDGLENVWRKLAQRISVEFLV
jgi:hypothetical protein